MPRKRSHAELAMCRFIVTLLAASLLPVAAAHAAGTPYNTSITNQATATYKDSSANSFEATSNSTTVTVTAVYTVSVTAPPDASGNTNTVVYYPYTVTNTGNNTNTFALSAASGAGGNTWAVALYHDDDGDGVHDAGETTVTSSTGALAADATYRFFVAVTIPAAVANGQTDVTVLTVAGSGDAGTGDDATDSVTTTALAPALTVAKAVRNVTLGGSFDTTASAAPTQVLEYRITVTNAGSISADNVTLTDADGAYTTYVPNSMYIGGNGTAAASNTLQDDDASGGTACASDACGHSSVSGGTVTAYLGTGATESASDARTFAAGSTVYVYFRVTVD
jgi:uncharacterized repeat protein (TIGR01451 family)